MCVGLWYRPPSNSGALDDLYSIFENLDISVLTQVVPQPTRFNSSGSSTLLDLVLLSVPSQLVNCSVITPLGNSDDN